MTSTTGFDTFDGNVGDRLSERERRYEEALKGIFKKARENPDLSERLNLVVKTATQLADRIGAKYGLQDDDKFRYDVLDVCILKIESYDQSRADLWKFIYGITDRTAKARRRQLDRHREVILPEDDLLATPLRPIDSPQLDDGPAVFEDILNRADVERHIDGQRAHWKAYRKVILSQREKSLPEVQLVAVYNVMLRTKTPSLAVPYLHYFGEVGRPEIVRRFDMKPDTVDRQISRFKNRVKVCSDKLLNILGLP